MSYKKYFILTVVLAVTLIGGSQLLAEEQDDVNITADVQESITFSVSETDVEFGALDSSNARYATGGADSGGADSETTAHTFTVGTNADGGFDVQVTGTSLQASTSDGTSTITAIDPPAASSPGSEQFGLAVISDDGGGSGTISGDYDNSDDEYYFADSTTVVSSSDVSADHTFDLAYLANIESLTPAGSYDTTLSYIATASF